MIWDDYNGPNALDARYQDIRKKIADVFYFGEKRAQGWAKYVARHKELHLASSVLAMQGYNDFTGRERVTSLLDGIRTNNLDVPIGLINMNDAYRSDFEAAQKQIAEHIRLRRDRDKGSRNASAVSVDGGRGRGSGRGDGGRGGRGGRSNGGGHGDGRPWKPITDEDGMKCTWIDKTWYPDDVYAKFNGHEKRKLFLNQEAQRKRDGKPLKARNAHTAPVREVSGMITVISQLSASVASVASVAETCNDTAKSLKRMKRTTQYNSLE